MSNLNMPSQNHDTDKRLVHEQFLRREYNMSHLTLEREYAFYQAVVAGDQEQVEEIMLPLKAEGLGHLSDNSVRNMKYHLIITIALITRFCIEGGMPPEDAYSLSDIYIQRLDHLLTENEVSALHQETIFAYTQKMKTVRRQMSYSKLTISIIDYIYDHLHEKIELDDLAQTIGYTKTYLCDRFKSETGFTIGDYILRRKIEAAQNMLKYSAYSGPDIGNYLGFSSHSHFIASFKKITCLTPKQYRDKHFRQEFT